MTNSLHRLLFPALLAVFAGCATSPEPSFPSGSGKQFPAYKGRVEYKSAGDKQIVVTRLESGEVYLLRPESNVWDLLAGQTLVFRGTIVPVASSGEKPGGKVTPEDLWKTKALFVQGKPESVLKNQRAELPDTLSAPPPAGPALPGTLGSGDR